MERRYSTGRKRITTEEQNMRLIHALRTNPFSNIAQASREQDFPYQIARKRVIENGLHCYIAAKQTELTREQRDERIQFCRNMLEMQHIYNDIIFTDEKVFCSDLNRRVLVYRPRNERYNEAYISHTRLSGRISTGYWGWMSIAGPGEMVTIDGKFNSQQYIDILDGPGLRSMEYQFGSLNNLIFQQDNSPVHTARVISDYLQTKQFKMILDWPSNSPDLNLIENVWAVMVYDWPRIADRTKANLDRLLFQRWEQLRGQQGKQPEGLTISLYY